MTETKKSEPSRVVKIADAKVGDLVILQTWMGWGTNVHEVYGFTRVTWAGKKLIKANGGKEYKRENGHGHRKGTRSVLLDPTPELMIKVAQCEAKEAAQEKKYRDTEIAHNKNRQSRAATAVFWLATTDGFKMAKYLSEQVLNDVYDELVHHKQITEVNCGPEEGKQKAPETASDSGD